jgi:hypothetical protein
MDSDPSIRWQVMQDLLHASADKVTSEQAKVATEGWGATILANQSENGTWNPDHRFPEMATLRSLSLLCDMGLDPRSEQAKHAIARVQSNVRWLMKISEEELPKDEDISWWRNPFFVGEVEPCINGRVLRVGAYFGMDMQALVDRLLGEQMADGGWNCEQEAGSKRGSFHTTINVLEGLLEFEQSTRKSPDVSAALERGHEYLLQRHLFRRLSTGEPIKEGLKDTHNWTQFSYPVGWRYDILRGLDYLCKAEVVLDPRMAEAIEVVKSKRDRKGRWPLDIRYEEELVAELDVEEGQPSYWNTLRSMRVLVWYST